MSLVLSSCCAWRTFWEGGVVLKARSVDVYEGAWVHIASETRPSTDSFVFAVYTTKGCPKRCP